MTGPRQLLIVRHAPAEDASAEGDRGRALTAEGRAEMAQAAAGLARLIDPIGLIAASPLRRARETADLLAASWPKAARAELPELEPGFDRDALATWIDAQDAAGLALVGHEPDLSGLVSWLIAGPAGARLHLRKGAAALLSLRGRCGPRSGELEWFMTRGALRRLGAAKP
jgi:phosphohistidine phosphatase